MTDCCQSGHMASRQQRIKVSKKHHKEYGAIHLYYVWLLDEYYMYKMLQNNNWLR